MVATVPASKQITATRANPSPVAMATGMLRPGPLARTARRRCRPPGHRAARGGQRRRGPEVPRPQRGRADRCHPPLGLGLGTTLGGGFGARRRGSVGRGGPARPVVLVVPPAAGGGTPLGG